MANSIRECRGRVGHGFARVPSRNAFRMEFDDGTAFYPIGVQTGASSAWSRTAPKSVVRPGR